MNQKLSNEDSLASSEIQKAHPDVQNRKHCLVA